MIENIIIKNYKSIRNIQLELKPLNILIGANGAGKSNFISFFDFANSIFEQKLQSFVLQRGIDNLLYFGRKKSDEINGLIDFDNTNCLFFSIKPTQTNRAYIDFFGDYFNNKNLKDKNYKNWSKKTWNKAVEEIDFKEDKEWRAKYTKKF
jgi:predicted ATPase